MTEPEKSSDLREISQADASPALC